jgi:hypothetical protein
MLQGIALKAREVVIAGETNFTRTSPSLSETTERAIGWAMTMWDAPEKSGHTGAAHTPIRIIGAPFTVPARYHLRSSSLERKGYALVYSRFAALPANGLLCSHEQARIQLDQPSISNPSRGEVSSPREEGSLLRSSPAGAVRNDR